MRNNNDPTYSQSSYLRVNVINNGAINRPRLAKGSVRSPSSRRWEEGKDFWLYEFQQEWSGKTPPYFVWSFCTAQFPSRGPESVAKGDVYHYEVTVDPGSYRLALDIVGVEGGSVLRPAIGLYNLVSKPDDWTYFRPETFTGEWGLEVINPGHPMPVGVAVCYNPGQKEKRQPYLRGWSYINIRCDSYPSKEWWSPTAASDDETRAVTVSVAPDQPREVLLRPGTVEILASEAGRVLQEV